MSTSRNGEDLPSQWLFGLFAPLKYVINQLNVPLGDQYAFSKLSTFFA